MTEPLRAAVIGVGAFGRHHARIYSELAPEGVELVGLVDIAHEGPAKIASQLGVPLVDRFDRLPQKPDVVSIAVPTTAHEMVAEPLLRHGIHCLVEKPVAGSTAAAARLIDAAASGAAHLQVGLVERYNPVAGALEHFDEAPVFIEMHRLAPWSGRCLDTDVVMDMMIHDLDLLQHIVGEVPSEIQAVGLGMLSPQGSGLHDLVNVRLSFPSGCVANLTASRVAEQRRRRVRVFGRRGYLRLDLDRAQAELVRFPRRRRTYGARVADLARRTVGLDAARAEAAEAPFEHQLVTQRLRVGSAEPLRAEIEALVRAARTGERPPVGGQEGLRALDLAERIMAACRIPLGGKR